MATNDDNNLETKVYTSSTIVSSVYNFKERRLVIRFYSGRVYKYDNVSLDDYKRFSGNNLSTGKAFYQYIGDKYKGTRVQ